MQNKLKLLNKVFRNYKVYFLNLGTEFYFSVNHHKPAFSLRGLIFQKLGQESKFDFVDFKVKYNAINIINK